MQVVMQLATFRKVIAQIILLMVILLLLIKISVNYTMQLQKALFVDQIRVVRLDARL